MDPPVYKKSWSLGINQGEAIYCFTLHNPLESAPPQHDDGDDDNIDDDDNKLGAGNLFFFSLPSTVTKMIINEAPTLHRSQFNPAIPKGHIIHTS